MYAYMYVCIRVRDEEPMLSKHDTDQKLEHDVLKARALIPSQFSVPIHRKGSKYDNDQTLPCLYRAKARCSTHPKASMSHRGETPEVLHVTIVQCPYIGTRSKYETDQKLDVTYTANAVPSSGLRLSFELQVSNESPNANTNAQTQI